MELHLIIEGGRELSEQVYNQISQAIRAGRLAPGQQLPSTRLLAQQLGISRKPVAEAYSRLTYDRILVAHPGRGTFVGDAGGTGTRQVKEAQLGSRATLAKWMAWDSPFREPYAYGRSGGAPALAHRQPTNFRSVCR